MPYIQLYDDAACTQKFAAFPTIDINPTSAPAPFNLTIGGKVYKCFGQASGQLSVFTCPRPQTSPAFSNYKDRFRNGKTLYTKNSFRFTVYETSVVGQYCRLTDIRYGTSSVNIFQGGQAMVSATSSLGAFFVRYVANGVAYLGLTNFWESTTTTMIPAFLIEEKFWTENLRPPYDYGTGTDGDGGQGTGKIPHTDIPLTATPSKIVPIGGRGLHAYRINTAAYGSLQGYLWGDSSTLAKSLWQKFNNKTHNPVSCIVGCFSLPVDFMPTGTGNTGINLAGLYLSPISGTCVSVGGSIGFVDKTITFGAIEAPFHNFLDYTAITCKIHVPFCGEMAIAPEQIIGSELTLRYRVDQLNGNIVAAVKANGIVLCELSGNCAYNIPLSGGDDGTLQRLGAITSGITSVVQDNVQGAMVAMQNGMNAGFSAQLVNSDLHGSTTACENRVPYLVWTYSGTAYTPDYAQAQGVPCEFSGNLGAFSGGYGEFEIMSNSPALQLVYDVMGATEIEKQEIAALLRNGVIV